MDVDRIKGILMAETAKAAIPKKDLLSTGSTLINLACTGFPDGGFFKGAYFWLVGDSQSGKTFLALTCLAEASLNKEFNDYRLIHDDVEGGSLMDIRKFFGDAVAKRLEPPKRDSEGDPLYSQTIEDFYFNLDDALDHKRPCIYILDSMDGLSSEYEGKKFDERKTAAEKGTVAKGDYGDGKAKRNSGSIRHMLARIRDTGSILIIISQTRDNIDAGLFGEKSTVSGGRALKFYASLQLWSSVGSAIKVTVRGKERRVGVISRVRVKKNRTTGRDRGVEVPIYYSVGFDDVGGCVDYLVNEKYWPRNKGGMITAKEFDLQLNRDDMIETIESRDLEFDLRQLVADVWHDIEAACAVQRKTRYPVG